MKSRLLTLILGGIGLPLLAFADDIRIFKPPLDNSITFTTLANKFGTIANAVIPFLIGVAVVVILWGIFKYLSAAGSEEKLAEGRRAALYGVIALFLMVAFWGFVIMIKNSLFE